MDELHALLGLLSDGRPSSRAAIADTLRIGDVRLDALARVAADRGVPLVLAGGEMRLTRPLELLDSERILGALSPVRRALLSGLEVYPEVDSTNRVLLERSAAGLPSGSVCLAEYQSSGRGRNGRQWQSPYGTNLALSLYWKFGAQTRLEGLSLAIGVGVARGLDELGVHDVGLKWPNDVLVGGKKLAGILIETRPRTEHGWPVVIGTGLNLFTPPEWSHSIDQGWTDVASSSRVHVGRNRAAALMVGHLLESAETFSARGFTAFQAAWRQRDLAYGKPVEVRQGEKVLAGVGQGIDDQGALVVLVDGELRRMASAQLSLRIEPMGH